MNNIPNTPSQHNTEHVRAPRAQQNTNNAQAPFRAGDNHTGNHRPDNGQGQNLRNLPADRTHLRDLNADNNPTTLTEPLEAQLVETAEQVLDLAPETLNNLPIANVSSETEVDVKKAQFVEVENLKNKLINIVNSTQYKGVERANLLRTTKSDYKFMLSNIAKQVHNMDDLTGHDNQALNTYKYNVARFTDQYMKQSDLGYRIGKALLNHMGFSRVAVVQAEPMENIL